ncbi:MAG: DUF4251 domain-containing protein [Bacteroidota bacterium]
MKRAALLFVLVLFAFYLPAQETRKETLSRQEMRKKKKEEKEVKLQKQFMVVYRALLDSSFVLEADFLENKDGLRLGVRSVLNFIAVDSSVAAVQVGLDHRLGFNGSGGFTDKGKITRYKLSRNDKNKTCLLTMAMRGSVSAHLDLYFTVSAYGTATAVLSGGPFGQRFTFDGRIVPLKESNVFEGLSP